MKKIPSKKIDIIRWALLLPITFFIIASFGSLIIGSEEYLQSFFNRQAVIKIIDYSILVLMPIVIALCGFFIAPKNKLISVVIMICISLTPYMLSFDMDNSIREVSNFSQIKHIDFINPFTITTLILLLIIYKLEK